MSSCTVFGCLEIAADVRNLLTYSRSSVKFTVIAKCGESVPLANQNNVDHNNDVKHNNLEQKTISVMGQQTSAFPSAFRKRISQKRILMSVWYAVVLLFCVSFKVACESWICNLLFRTRKVQCNYCVIRGTGGPGPPRRAVYSRSWNSAVTLGPDSVTLHHNTTQQCRLVSGQPSGQSPSGAPLAG